MPCLSFPSWGMGRRLSFWHSRAVTGGAGRGTRLFWGGYFYPWVSQQGAQRGPSQPTTPGPLFPAAPPAARGWPAPPISPFFPLWLYLNPFPTPPASYQPATPQRKPLPAAPAQGPAAEAESLRQQQRNRIWVKISFSARKKKAEGTRRRRHGPAPGSPGPPIPPPTAPSPSLPLLPSKI